jgi:hypothetical protein
MIGFTKNGKFRPTGNNHNNKILVKSHGNKMTESDLRAKFGKGYEHWSAKSLATHQKNNDTYSRMEDDLTEWFNGYDYNVIKKEVDKEKMKLSDFDSDNYDDEYDDGESNKIIGVTFLAPESHLLTDVLSNDSYKGHDEVKYELVSEFSMGKGDDIIKNKLGKDYSLYLRDGDMFVVKGI